MRRHLIGTRAIKEDGEKWLPFLGDPTDEDDRDNYNRYKTRAMYLEATKRTHQALSGAITWKQPVITDLSEGMLDKLNDVTMEGHSFYMLVGKVVEQVVAVSRCGVLVDLPVVNETFNKGEHPYFVMYKTEDVINWRHERIGDQIKLTLVVLRETFWEEGDDEFQPNERRRYRVLRLRDGVYTQQEIVEVDGRFEEAEETLPRIRGEAMDFIPFAFITPDGNTPAIADLLLSGVMEVNTSHYITSADLEHGRHFTALPQAWVSGFDSSTELRIGSGVAWVTENPDARAGYLEFTGAGLASLERALEQKERQMATLGAKLMEGQRPGVLAAETARINASGESSVLASLSQSIEAAITDLLRMWVQMQASEEVPFVEMNKDFIDNRMDPAELSGLLQAYITGAVSYDTLFYNLQRGEIIAPEVSLEDEQSKVEARQRELALENGGAGFDNTE